MSYVLLDDEPKFAFGTCDRCGWEWKFFREYLTRASYSTEYCADCRMKPVRYIGPQGDPCRPWDGDVNLDTMQPINADGSLYRPGRRTCGNSDCVRTSHITSDETAA